MKCNFENVNESFWIKKLRKLNSVTKTVNIVPWPIRRPMVGEHGRSEGRKSHGLLPVSLRIARSKDATTQCVCCVFLNVQQSHHVNYSQLAVIGTRITKCSKTVTLSGNDTMLAWPRSERETLNDFIFFPF